MTFVEAVGTFVVGVAITLVGLGFVTPPKLRSINETRRRWLRLFAVVSGLAIMAISAYKMYKERH
jgi:hypothetical protein